MEAWFWRSILDAMIDVAEIAGDKRIALDLTCTGYVMGYGDAGWFKDMSDVYFQKLYLKFSDFWAGNYKSDSSVRGSPSARSDCH